MQPALQVLLGGPCGCTVWLVAVAVPSPASVGRVVRVWSAANTGVVTSRIAIATAYMDACAIVNTKN